MHVLETVFQKSPAEAYRVMMQVHLNGRGIAGVYPWEVAETKVDDGHLAWRAPPGSRCARRSKKRELIPVFSASLEIVLTIAYREAVSRRHAYLTLEHLLYALAHDPDGERILARLRRRPAAAAPRAERLPRASRSSSCSAARSASPSRRRRSAACCRRRCCTCRARSAQEVHAGDICAAILQQPKTQAARLLAAQGITRLDVLEYISHGITKTPVAGPSDRRRARRRRPATGDEGPATARDPLVGLLPQPDRARAAGPARSADRPRRRAAAHDRSAVPPPQEQPGVRRRGRRRQDGDGRRPRDAAARRRRPGRAEGRGGLLARHRRAARRHALPRRLRGALQGGHQGAQPPAAARSSSSTRSTRPSAPARPPAARWIWRR